MGKRGRVNVRLADRSKVDNGDGQPSVVSQLLGHNLEDLIGWILRGMFKLDSNHLLAADKSKTIPTFSRRGVVLDLLLKLN